MKYASMGAFFLLLAVSGFSQVSKDSINILKQQKESLELSSKINEHKMQLAKLENTVNAKTQERDKTAAEAQKAADDNATAAADLSRDPQDRKLAKKAEKAGNYAKKCAKRARSANDNLDGLTKDIESLRNKIAGEEAKLAANPVIIPVQQ